ncbi:PREDICTED: neuropeptide CCHamide-2 receptor [Drosophila arizonae]|uniref:Neuropeptide CCHamide-2 receptor n=1 Tax=Drosophila arizonae TaxID=7263 RepID=A0ABM1PP19_DROAR|nr:PREDICTED: neuropeptide CCHamide-2 receptor [Drosophila arizonae]
MYAALMDMSQMLAASLAYAPAESSSAAAAAGVNLSQLSNSSQLDGSSVVTVATAATVAQHNASIEESSYVKVLDRPETYIVTVLYTLIFIVGVLGNGTLVIIFFRHRSMRNIPNTYILSLALADLLVILVCVPVATIVYTQESWPFERNMCRISEFFKDISIGVSVFTLTALSGERYCAIVNPLRKLQTKPLTVFTAVIIWVFAIMLGMPSFVVSDIQSYNITTPNGNITIGVCSPFRSKIYAKYMVVAKASIYYLVPLSIIGVLYIMMAKRLHISARDMPGEQLSIQSRSQARARRHVARMVVAFVVVFFICFFPYHVFELWYHFYPTAEDDFDDFWNVVRIVGFCTSFLNSCVNPVALYCVSGVFRQHFNRYLCCICVKRQPHLRQHSTATGIMDTSVTSMRRSTYVGGGIAAGGAREGGPRASVHMNNNHGVSGAAGGRGGSFHRQDSMALQHAGSINGHSHNANVGAGAGIGRASIINEKR